MTYQLAGGGRFHEFEPGGSSVEFERGYWQVIQLLESRYRALKAERLTLQTALRLRAFTTGIANRIAGTEEGVTRIVDVGYCKVDRTNAGLLCKAGVWQPQQAKVVLEQPGVESVSTGMGQNLESPYPFIVGLSPVDKWFISLAVPGTGPRANIEWPGAVIAISPNRPLGEFRRSLVLRDVRFEDYFPQ